MPKVLLIRKPRETVEAYRRVTGSSLHLYKLLSDNEFCERLESEIETWQNRWLEVAEGSKSMLVITKDGVVNNTKGVVRWILDAMGQEHVVVPENYTLPEKRVSKVPEQFQISVLPASG